MNPGKKTTRKAAQKSARSSAAKAKTNKGLTPEEISAMKETLRERKAAGNRAEEERMLLAKIAEMPEPDRSMGKRLHSIITANAPALAPKTWYGMPAYARDGKVVCFFQGASKFNARYATFGFNDSARLDEGSMWPTAFALKELTPADEAKIIALVKKAVS
jgi:uncharacterized protein YdhG (YjbR/CyaY superfamily)